MIWANGPPPTLMCCWRSADARFWTATTGSYCPYIKKLNVRTQSTLIVYKQGAEVGRSVGDTNRDSIAKLLAKTI
jgi:hypothetical protein